MKRDIFQNLQRWKQDISRKPLILRGARQVGKTYTLTTFGAQEYDNVAYLNFENSPHLHDLFAGSLKPQDIIKILSIELSIEIKPGKTLLIFDEIQECSSALNSLKYFNEMANEYHICAAGSLLGVTLANSKGFPVGKVDVLNLYPLSAYINHDIFKIYLADVGLLGAMTRLSERTIIYGNEIFQEFQGALSENYVAQELVRQGYETFYWTSAGQAELDFVLQFEDVVYPLEVKSGTSSKKKSLNTYIQKYQPRLAIRVSPMNLKLDGLTFNCPLYLMSKLTNLIKKVFC